MKTSLKNMVNTLVLLIVTAIFSGLVSCSDTNNPLGSADQNNNAGLSASNNTINGVDIQNNSTNENYALGDRNTDAKKRALPLPCLNLSREQMVAFADLQSALERKNAQLRKEYEAKIKAIREANSVRGARLTPEAKARMDAAVKKLTEQLNADMAANERAFIAAFRNLLTPEQQAIFDAWAKGRDCDRVVKRTGR